MLVVLVFREYEYKQDLKCFYEQDVSRRYDVFYQKLKDFLIRRR
jgi:hypothetical protein